MTEHAHHTHSGGQQHHDEAGLADLLDRDAEILDYLDEVTAWVSSHAARAPRTIVDVGAGTGTGTIALAQSFPTAEVIAIDRSSFMLERLQESAGEEGMSHRVHVVQADLDVAWPGDVAAADVVWAASSMHEVADPDRVLRDIYAALKPGGVLVIVEMDTFPRFLPDDIGLGKPGLEARCHEALTKLEWNVHPDWRPYLERAGFDFVEQRGFTVEAQPAQPAIGRYAQTNLLRIRSAVEGKVNSEDLGTLDRLLTDDGPDALLRRGDLSIRAPRTAWAARRP
jgi:ubiquinone/menaquinone biosynthesis C-methylase UbiE